MSNVRCCKVVALYPPWAETKLATPRQGDTNSPTNDEDWMQCVKRLVEGETNVHPGRNISLDVHLVWNFEDAYHHKFDRARYEKFIYSFNGKKTLTGTIHVSEQKNRRHGFTAFGCIAEKHYEDYEYWCYQEDDHYIIPSGKGYLRQAVNQLKSNSKLKCVALSPIKHSPETQVKIKLLDWDVYWHPSGYPSHFGGGYGVWHRKHMDMDKFPFSEKNMKELPPFLWGEGAMCSWLQSGARSLVAFEPIENYSNAPENFQYLPTYVAAAKDDDTEVFFEEPFIFRVGLGGGDEDYVVE